MKEKEEYYCKCGREIDYEFIKHTIAIVCRSFVKANEIIEILQKEGIFKGGENKMAKVEFIPKHQYPICYKCEGKGCNVCDNTGKFREDFYHLIYTNNEGQKIAFGVDGLKKKKNIWK